MCVPERNEEHYEKVRKEVRREVGWGGRQWHSVSTEFCDSLSVGLNLKWERRTYIHVQHGDLKHLPTYLWYLLSIYISVCLSTHPPTYLPTHLSTYLPTYLSICLSVYPPTYLPIYLSTYLPIYLSVCLSASLSTLPPTNPCSPVSVFPPGFCLSVCIKTYHSDDWHPHTISNYSTRGNEWLQMSTHTHTHTHTQISDIIGSSFL
jgi:hypothetical protein